MASVYLALDQIPCVLYGVKCIDLVSLAPCQARSPRFGNDTHLGLICAPYILYGAKNIGLVSLAPCPSNSPRFRSGLNLDLSRAPYILYGVKYIDLVCRAPWQAHHTVCRRETDGVPDAHVRYLSFGGHRYPCIPLHLLLRGSSSFNFNFNFHQTEIFTKGCSAK